MSRRQQTYIVDEDGLPQKLTRGQEMSRFCYNKDTGQCCGRTATGWFKLASFYLVFYIILSGFVIGYLYGYMTTVDEFEPTWSYLNDQQPYLKNPGLGMLPRPELGWGAGSSGNFAELGFNPDDKDTYKNYVKQLKDYLKGYSGKNTTRVAACRGAGYDECPVSLDRLANCSDTSGNLGYDTGNPCILLKLNKILGWSPEAYSKDPLTPVNPNANVTKYQDSEHGNARLYGYDHSTENIGISCQEINKYTPAAAAEGHLKGVEFFPSHGLPFSCFPYCGKNSEEKYLSPLVMIRVNIPRDQMVYIWCKAWAKNIMHDRRDKAGSLMFGLYIQK